MHQTLISSLPMDDSDLDWECSSPCFSCWHCYLHEYALRNKYLLPLQAQSPSAYQYPRYRLPASQGPQETHGRDKGLNPYENPPITDWSKKTTKELKETCKLPAYRKSPVCRSFR